MEADWEFEIGVDAPLIDAQWPGFVDLRSAPELALQLPEAAQLPALAAALAALNAPASPVWTSKCDVWPATAPGDFDPVELDAPPGNAAHAIACYIDLLPASSEQWSEPAAVEADCHRLCILLRRIPLRSCRADLIIRQALVPPGQTGLGITAYLTACGSAPAQAGETLQVALAAFAGTLAAQSTVE
jgi:hypothetical protein